MISHSLLNVGASAGEDRQPEDFYATEPVAADLLEWAEDLSHHLWEPACGAGHLAERFHQMGHIVKASDIVERGYAGTELLDFVKDDLSDFDGDIVTNPPFSLAEDFIYNGIACLQPGRKLCLFLKLTFYESAKRDSLFKTFPPARIHVCKNRIKCAKNGDFSKVKSSPTCYAWFVWERNFKGQTIIDRI